MPRYARLIYNGYWFSPERTLLQGLIDASQAPVNGTVRLKLYKGTVMCVGRASSDRFAVRREDRDVRRRCRRVRPEGRRRLHQAQCVAAANRGESRPLARLTFTTRNRGDRGGPERYRSAGSSPRPGVPPRPCTAPRATAAGRSGPARAGRAPYARRDRSRAGARRRRTRPCPDCVVRENVIRTGNSALISRIRSACSWPMPPFR